MVTAEWRDDSFRVHVSTAFIVVQEQQRITKAGGDTGNIWTSSTVFVDECNS